VKCLIVTQFTPIESLGRLIDAAVPGNGFGKVAVAFNLRSQGPKIVDLDVAIAEGKLCVRLAQGSRSDQRQIRIGSVRVE
jgi:hypothetical protein